MNLQLRTMKPIILLLSAIVTGWLYFTNAFEKKAESNLNQKDFDYNFNVKDLEGRSLAFKEYKDKVVFLNLWATWCGPCRYEMPGIQKLFNSVDSNKIVFVMLSLDREGDLVKVASYAKNNAFTFPVFMSSGNLTSQLNVPSIPTTFIIDRKGKIVLQHIGSTNYDTDKYRKLLTDLSKD